MRRLLFGRNRLTELHCIQGGNITAQRLEDKDGDLITDVSGKHQESAILVTSRARDGGRMYPETTLIKGFIRVSQGEKGTLEDKSERRGSLHGWQPPEPEYPADRTAQPSRRIVLWCESEKSAQLTQPAFDL